MAYFKLALLLAVFSQLYYETSASCPSGWIYSSLADRCFKYMHKKGTWDQAQVMCKEVGGTLPMPKSKNIQDALMNFRRDHVRKNAVIWIGLNDKSHAKKFVWDDGEHLGGYHPWRLFEPNNAGGNERCVDIGPMFGMWNDINCRKNPGNNDGHIVCQRYKNKPIQRCPTGWTYNSMVDRCWWYSGQESDWHGAQRICKSHGATLPMTKTKQMHNEFNAWRQKKIVNTAWVWIGLNDIQTAKQFFWDDGSRLNGNTQWRFGEPNNAWNNERCVYMEGIIGNWNDIKCDRGNIYVACEKPGAIMCAANPCKNGAACHDSGTGYACTCRHGYSGKNCGAVVNNCSPNPCKNGAPCHSSVGDFTCSCPPGFTGKRCNAAINHCANSPCKNGAECQSLTSGYRCMCPPGSGFTGRNCDEAINHCANSPCKNGASCQSLKLSYKCICTLGYSGKNCDKAVNHCKPMPCKNGATCKSSAKGFACKCPIGYIGKLCDKVDRQTMMVRKNGAVDFNRNWKSYENGFGNCGSGDCWIGLKKLHKLCSKNCKLQIAMEFYGKHNHAVYTTFKVGPASDKYRLTIGGYTPGSNAGDDLSPKANGMQFTTKDQDNDLYGENCAVKFTGGWWHNKCFWVHPTGTWGSKEFAKGLNWKSITGFTDTLSSIIMKVTPVA